MSRRRRYGRDRRLTSTRDFARVFKSRKRYSNRLVTAVVLNRGGRAARLGVVVSRKVSKKAVDRNRIKRLFRESFRLHQGQLTGCDIVLLAAPKCKYANNQQLHASLVDIWSTIEKKCVVC